MRTTLTRVQLLLDQKHGRAVGTQLRQTWFGAKPPEGTMGTRSGLRMLLRKIGEKFSRATVSSEARP